MSTLKVASINNPSAGSGGLAISAAGNVTGAGLDLIVTQSFSAVSSVSLDNCFSGDYDNYRVLAQVTGSTGANLNVRYRAAAADNSTANYNYSLYGIQYGGTVGMVANGSGQTSLQAGLIISNLNAAVSMDIYRPFASSHTENVVTGAASDRATLGSSVFSSAASFDGLSLIPSAGTITGTVSVYGFKS